MIILDRIMKDLWWEASRDTRSQQPLYFKFWVLMWKSKEAGGLAMRDVIH